jgi:hypothetical protein
MRTLFLALLVVASPIALAQNPYDDGYRRGYKEGFSEGYREGQEDSRGAPQAAPAPAGGPINVQVARYGSPNKVCDATRHVRLKAQGKLSASIDVSNSICGDPDPGQRKELEVSYTCGNVAKTASAYEHRTAYLDCSY